MKNACIVRLTGCLAALAVLGTPALAGGEWYRGGLKDYAGVPVPAPVPVPIYKPVWYLRIDASVAFGESPEAEQNGIVLGEGNAEYSAVDTFGVPASWVEHHFAQHAMYGGGFGYRWSDWFRTDVTGESMRDARVTIEGSRNVPAWSDPMLPAATSYDIDTRDITSIRGMTFLANGYVDFPNHWRNFTPYIGGGLGFAVARIKRHNTTTEFANGPDEMTVDAYSESTATEFSLAAAATAGVTYSFTQSVELDVAYRYLFIQGMDADLLVNGHQSRVSVDATNDHQIRAGLRFNID